MTPNPSINRTVSARTLQDWEQGRREPNGAAKTLLLVAVAHPEVLRGLHG
jgi:putative transcriptional regulator